jgi:hypothetical protein
MTFDLEFFVRRCHPERWCEAINTRRERPHGRPVVGQFEIGNPDPAHVSTSYVERQNLTMRMSMRRFTRPTNAFSKKVDNHRHAVALYFVYYNFCRVHQTLRVTPAMESGLADHVWGLDELVGLLEHNGAETVA